MDNHKAELERLLNKKKTSNTDTKEDIQIIQLAKLTKKTIPDEYMILSNIKPIEGVADTIKRLNALLERLT